MTEIRYKFRNVIVCEDIRQEVHGKWSLMGVFSGDIVVPDFPSHVQAAFYLEYVPDPEDNHKLAFEFRLLQDDNELIKGHSEAEIEKGQVATIVLPRGIAAFEKEATLRVCVSVNGGKEIEVVNKRILKGLIPST